MDVEQLGQLLPELVVILFWRLPVEQGLTSAALGERTTAAKAPWTTIAISDQHVRAARAVRHIVVLEATRS
jgi:hypothetical protein